MNSEGARTSSEQQADVRRLRARNAELENSNRLLVQELAEARRREMLGRAEAVSVRALVESNILGVMFAMPDGTLTDANGTLLKMLGYSSEDVAAGELRWQNLSPEDDVFEEWCAAGALAPKAVQLRSKGGVRVELIFWAVRVSGKPPQVIGFFLGPPSPSGAGRSRLGAAGIL